MTKIDDPRLFEPQCSSLEPVETVHENPWFAVRNRGGHFTVEYHLPQVMVMPIVDRHSVVMVQGDRPIIADTPLELPAGGAEAEESPLEAVARELGEETGIRIDNLDRFEMLSPMADSPIRFPTLLYVYQIHITQQEYDNRGCHDDEVCKVLCIRFEDVCRMIVRGEIYISMPVAIVGRFLLGHFYADGREYL